AITGTTIADSAYRGHTALKSVTIPAGVTSIGAAAFMGCTGLESVTIEGACTIGDNAFYGCTSLKTLVINGNVTEIGNCAFGNTQIESVVLPASVKKFGHTLFSPATKNVTIRSTEIKAMESHAFFNLCDSSTITFAGTAKPSTKELYHKDGNYASYGDWGAFWYGKTRSTIK
ncbi:MAG: leucine-rich repeat domain-containing protein, partial [Treponema sp.]|nr:leucine-rich repeat domain-containing protein [Treponema sp.]